MRRRPLILLAVLALVLPACGGGGGDDPESTAAGPPTTRTSTAPPSAQVRFEEADAEVRAGAGIWRQNTPFAIAQGDLENVQIQADDLRRAVLNLDARARALALPAAVAVDREILFRADTRLIADLTRISRAPGTAPRLVRRVDRDLDEVTGASRVLRTALARPG